MNLILYCLVEARELTSLAFCCLLVCATFTYIPPGVPSWNIKASRGAKISNRYNQVPHLTQDTNGKVTNSQLDITNESQEVSPFPAGDHKAHINSH